MFDKRTELYKVTIIRFVIATIILVVNTSIFGLGQTPVYFLIACIYFLTIVYSLLLLLKLSNAVFLYTQIIIDLVIATLLIYYTGGIDSVLGLLYPLASIAASIVISSRAAVIIALMGSIFYSAMVSLEYFGIIPVPVNTTLILFRDSTYVFTLLYFRVTVFCTIGFLSAYLAEQVKKKDRVVISLQERLRLEDRLSAIGKLAASTAHEIRNPLASISGCVEALKESLELNSHNQKLFNLIMTETTRLNNVINGLLEYVKPRKLQPEKISLGELIDEVVMLVQNSKDFKKGVLIKKEGSCDSLKIICDAQMIKQVFFNLIVNAVEAVAEHGKIIIRERIDRAKNEVRIDVIDDGIGVAKEHLVTLFEPFSSGKEKGVGLGLAIASSIIKEHGGNIELESRLGRGATFSVFLPLSAKQK